MSNDFRAEPDLRLTDLQLKRLLRSCTHGPSRGGPAVGVEALLAALEPVFGEAIDAADDRELDAELERLSFDPQEVTRTAGAFRKQLHEEHLRGVASGGGPGAAAAGREAAAPRQGRADVDEDEVGPLEPAAAAGALATRTILVAIEPEQVAEAASIRGNLHRIQAPTGLAGRLGIRLDVSFDDPPPGATFTGRDREPPDLAILCRPPGERPHQRAFPELWRPLRGRGGAQDGSAPPQADRARRLRVVELVALDRCAAPAQRAGGGVARYPDRLDAAAPDVEIVCYDDDREFEQACQRVLAHWLLAVRLELLYGAHGVQYAMPPGRTTLCVSLAGGRALGSEPVELSENSAHLWNRVGTLIGHHEGVLGGTVLDVACFHFAGHGRHRRAAEAGLRLIEEMARYGVRDRPVDGASFLRLAIHDLPEHPTGSPRLPEGFGLLLALAEKEEVEGRFAATAPVLKGLPSELRSRFQAGGRFCGVPFAVCDALLARSRPATPALSPRDLDDLSRFTVELEAAASADGAPRNRLLGAVDAAVDRFYSKLEACCRRVAKEGREKGGLRLRTVDLARPVLDLERRTWALVERISRRSISEGGDGSWRAPLYIAAARRASLVFELETATGHAGRGDTGGAAAAGAVKPAAEPGPEHPPTGNMLEAIRRVLRGDELDAYTGFIELTTHFKLPVMRYLRQASDVGCARSWLQGRLWQIAPYLVAEDFSELPAEDRLLLPAVLSGPLGDVRFRALGNFLDWNGRAPGWRPADELRARGAAVSFGNEQTLWQGRLLTAAHPERRREAAEKLDWDALWPLLTYPRTSLSAIAAIVSRFAEVRFERYGRICLDCVAPRLQRCLEAEPVDGPTLEGVWECVEVFSRFEFAASEASFERLTVVDDLFRQRSAAQGSAAESPLGRLLSRAPASWASAEERGRFLFSLPPVVQRHLASEGTYLEFFVCHPNPRIARETIRHVGPECVDRVVSLKAINVMAFLDLLHVPGLFRRLGALEAALRHPKCDSGFAVRNLGRLGQPALLRLIRHPDVNSHVRGQAEALLKVRGFPSLAPVPARARAGRNR